MGRSPGAGAPAVRAVAVDGLRPDELDELRRLFAAAWPDGGFGPGDWLHAMRGPHWLLEVEGRIASHASVDERELHAGGRPLRTGYLEAVATWPGLEGRGYGTAVVQAAMRHVRAGFELGGLSTGRPGFYERLGWKVWLGPTYVRTAAGLARTADDDGAVLVLETPATPDLDLHAPLSCDWREGDVW